MEIKPISAKETLLLRQQILRPGKSISACVFEGDEDPNSFHLAAFDGKILIGIVSIMAHRLAHFEEKNQFQLRGMAVLPKYRNRHIGAKLLSASENKLLESKTKILWCNARIKAVDFYKKCGFELLGDSFEIPDVGTHFLMFKRLDTI